MKKKIVVFAIVSLITILGGLLRFSNFTNNPPGLNIDEVSFGYSAYSILKTGRDETGAFMPIVFKSTGDYKNPVPVYLMVPSIFVFGLNELAVRFPTALISTLSIPMFFLFLKHLFKKDWIALSGSFLLAISAWHIYFSRYAYDPLLGLAFLTPGVWFFIKMIDGKRIYGVFAALFLVISMYSSFTERLFVPLFIFFGLIFNYKKILADKKNTLIFILLSTVLVSPLIYVSLFKSGNTRLGMVFFTQDIEFTRYVIMDHINKLGEPFLAFFFWANRYLNYLQPNYLFFNGLNMTRTGTLGLGVLYLFECPLLILGIIRLIKEKATWKNIIVIWLVLGILPASLANNDVSPGRSLIILPPLLIVLVLGVVSAKNILDKIKVSTLKRFAIVCIFGLIVFNIIQAFLIFAIHFPPQRGEDFMEGTKESVLYAIEHKDEYQEIVYDPYRGIEAPHIVNIPHMYILFYSKYDPSKYQREQQLFATEGSHFDKYTIRPINWVVDKDKRGTLFIGSPWSFPKDSLESNELLETIYLSNGHPAFYIVSPR